jgi:hypothetical protein
MTLLRMGRVGIGANGGDANAEYDTYQNIKSHKVDSNMASTRCRPLTIGNFNPIYNKEY